MPVDESRTRLYGATVDYAFYNSATEFWEFYLHRFHPALRDDCEFFSLAVDNPLFKVLLASAPVGAAGDLDWIRGARLLVKFQEGDLLNEDTVPVCLDLRVISLASGQGAPND